MNFMVLFGLLSLYITACLIAKYEDQIWKQAAKIKERRLKAVERKKAKKHYASLWRDADRLMCELPTADAIRTEVRLKTILMSESHSQHFMRRAEQYAADIHRIQTKFGRLRQRVSPRQSALPPTTVQVDELTRLNERMRARIQDIESLYRKIDRDQALQREVELNMPR
jgi:hypothetical protein